MARLLEIVLLGLACFFTSEADGCPPTCVCRTHGLVTCDPGLTEFPNNIPVDTVSLFLQGSEKETNSIPTLKEDHFEELVNLTALYVTHSKVRTIEENAFRAQTGLLRLDLSHNEIKNIKAGTFDDLEKLLFLDLSGNTHVYLDASVLRKLGHLKQLYLSEVGWRLLNKNLFQGLSSLQILDLSANNIRKLYPGIFKDLPCLSSLHLSGNRLRGLPEEFDGTFQRLSAAHLADNPWQCNCALAWLKNMTDFIFSPQEPDESVICSGPRQLQFQSLYSVDSSDMHCIPPTVQHCQPTSKSVEESNSAKISCSINGDPFPDITWHRPDGKTFSLEEDAIVAGYDLDENGTMIISKASKIDGGVWKIVAENTRGREEYTVSMEVTLKKSITEKSVKDQKKPTGGKSSDNLPVIIGSAGGGGVVALGLVATLYVLKRKKASKVQTTPRGFV